MSTAGLRQRRTGLTGFVENLDGFSKVAENVQEEKRSTAGIISLLSFVVIFVLVISEVHSHFFGKKQYDYRFSVDTDLHERPPLKMDFVIATPCNALSVASTNDAIDDQRDVEGITKSPSRFEFTDEEQLYWTILRHAHARMHSEGMRGLEDLEYVEDDVEEKLSHLADEKQEEESAKIEKEIEERRRKGDGGGEIVFMVASGMGMFQMVASSSKDEGSACRIHGRIPVRKGKTEKFLVALSSSLFHAHGDTKQRNVSHRIEQFNFGPRVTGLVSPLAGAEQISESGHDVYRYFLKVVPTKIYHGMFERYTMAYQYSVTFMKKSSDSTYSDGGIYIEYEFSATVIEIREKIKTFLQLLIRLCSIAGGVFATSQIINSLIQSALCLVGAAPSVLPGGGPASPQYTEEDKQRFLDSSNHLVH
ncbi:hypothetical protein PENTCL1PPCAC_28709 [Pristionchus entomophagus]|uniref:Endoplasmic reticulum vesicle transporter C-terminal domain-containing protein n=1 Tax=Pristionchus entomophagus TaxID=358040 RepID=A0AAV5UJW0_9BILA|nr:hypothetical protein PENTCL1PPCAC_28709 [Pristionchus entomophagus]